MPSTFRTSHAAATALMLLALAGCGDDNAEGAANAAAAPPAEVSVVTVAAQQLAVTTELPGRLEATRVAQVRARVPGIVLKRVFKEGSDVKAGAVLFRIDPAPFQATFNSARAALEKAQANLAQANAKLDRYKPLVGTGAISKQEYDDVMTAQKQALADVAASKAAQQSSRLSLDYATVTAPISGRIGRALVTEGALVGQGEATPLAIIQQLDPIYATLTQSTSEMMRLRRALSEGKLQQVGEGQVKVRLVTDDGTVYPHAGKLLFSDLTVDESSGSVTLRAEFPNPDRLLLPGMYVRARLDQAVRDSAIAVPQQAVTRSPDGASVMVVGADGKVTPRPVTTAGEKDGQWIISDGLKAGEQVIVEGLQKVQPGAVVKPVPWKNPLDAAQAGSATQGATGVSQSPPTAGSNSEDPTAEGAVAPAEGQNKATDATGKTGANAK